MARKLSQSQQLNKQSPTSLPTPPLNGTVPESFVVPVPTPTNFCAHGRAGGPVPTNGRAFAHEGACLCPRRVVPMACAHEIRRGVPAPTTFFTVPRNLCACAREFLHLCPRALELLSVHPRNDEACPCPRILCQACLCPPAVLV